jgi:two-component system LytT family response regulator
MSNKTIIIPNAKYAEIIRVDDIVFCKAAGSYAEIVLTNEQTITVSKNLHWFEERCGDSTFCRVHKSFLVNIVHVKRILVLENLAMLCNGKKIPISRAKKTLFWKKLESLGR